MKTKQIIIAIALLTGLVGCAPIYKCGDNKPVKTPPLLSKRVKKVIEERDSLCTDLAEKKGDILRLKNDSSNQSINMKNLEHKYDELSNDNIALRESMGKDLQQKTNELKAKSDELKNKERLLKDRESALNEMKKVIARQDSITKRLNDILRNALLGFKSDELSVEVKNGKVYVSLSDKLLFKSGSASIEQKGVDALKVLADVLTKNQDIDILVEGHTDSNPIKTAIFSDNWDLSAARAISIVRILINNYQITPTRLIASGRGEFSPKASNATAEGRAKNRRTEIILSPKLDELMKLLNSK